MQSVSYCVYMQGRAGENLQLVSIMPCASGGWHSEEALQFFSDVLNSIAMIHNGAICVLLSHNVVNEGVCMCACMFDVRAKAICKASVEQW